MAANPGAHEPRRFDGGVRRGVHIVKALALGAHGVWLGRAYAYGLAASGEAGVARVLHLLATEIDLTLALMGVPSVEALRADGHAWLRRAGEIRVPTP